MNGNRSFWLGHEFSSEEDHIILLLGAEQGFELRLVELGLAVEHCTYLTAHGGWQCLAQL